METGNISLDCAVVTVVLVYQLIEMRVQQWLSGSLYLRSFFPDPSWPYTFTAQQALEVPAIHDVVSLLFKAITSFGPSWISVAGDFTLRRCLEFGFSGILEWPLNWMWMLSLRVRIVLHKLCIDMIFPYIPYTWMCVHVSKCFMTQMWTLTVYTIFFCPLI